MSAFRLTQISDTHLGRRFPGLVANFHRVCEEGCSTGPHLCGQAEAELAVQVRGERTAVGWLEQRTPQEDRGALGRSSPICPLCRDSQSRDRMRLAGRLSELYGRQISLKVDVDPAVVGGVKVQVGADLYDGTVARRLAETRKALAG